MNKSELVTLLRDPGHLSSQQLEELETIVEDNPYFLSARLLLAKGSKEAKHPQTKKRIASAAVYSTDRILFKKYLSGDLFFLSQPKTEVQAPREKVVTASQSEGESVKKEAPREDKRPSALKPVDKKPVPEVPSVPAGDLDAILEELKQDMQNLKSSRAHFVEVQQQIVDKDELDSIKKAVEQEVALDSDQEVQSEAVSEPVAAEVKESTEDVSDLEPEVDAKEEAIKAKEAELKKKEAELKAKEEELKKEARAKEQEPEKETKEKKKTAAKKTATKAKAKKISTEEEDEVVSKKLAELALKKEKDKPEEKAAGKAKKKEADKPEKKATAKKEKTTTKKEEESKTSPPAEVKAKIEKSESEVKKEDEKPVGREKPTFDDQEERAEDPFKDSRFDRDATRSYLRKLEPPEDFPFFDDDEPADSPTEVSDSVSEKDLKEEEPKEEKSKTTTKAKADSPAPEAEEKPKRSAKKETTAKKEPASKKEPVSKKKPAAKKEATPEKETTAKKEVKPKENKPQEPAASPKSGESTAPKGSIMKKAKLVKSKRSSRKSGSSGTSKIAGSDKGSEDDGKSDRDQQKEIIDKFIKDSPSIKYTRETEGKTDDLSVGSGTWDKNLASEYLAEIYLKQGNKKRAIEIYEALSLKYPEKKSYFADLISKSK